MWRPLELPSAAISLVSLVPAFILRSICIAEDVTISEYNAVMSHRTKHTPILGRLSLSLVKQHRGVICQFRHEQKTYPLICSAKHSITNHTIRLTKSTGNAPHLCLLVVRSSFKLMAFQSFHALVTEILSLKCTSSSTEHASVL
jgi:hypothetical protein